MNFGDVKIVFKGQELVVRDAEFKFNNSGIMEVAASGYVPIGAAALWGKTGATSAYTDTSMPSGFANAMDQTKSVREWVKNIRQNQSHPGLGVGINVQWRTGGGYRLNVSVFGQTRDDLEYDDDFALLEEIQNVIAEAFS